MDLKHRSRNITDGRDRAPARAMFKSIGFTDDDLRKPIIGVAHEKPSQVVNLSTNGGNQLEQKIVS